MQILLWSSFVLVKTYLSWNYDMSSPNRSETNGIAEHAVRRVKEGTSALLVQSGLSDEWRREAMECFFLFANHTRQTDRQKFTV